MARIGWRNTPRRYGWVAMAFHWSIAALILFAFGLGLYMTSLEEGFEQFQLYQLHKSIGITVLLLAVLRGLWRLMNPHPPLPPGMPAWERWLAHFSHYGLYVFMLAVPFIGWAMVSVSPLEIPTFLYNELPWPHLPLGFIADREAAEGAFSEAHELMAFTLIFLFCLHVAGALKHHFIARDDVLRRMLPTKLGDDQI